MRGQIYIMSVILIVIFLILLRINTEIPTYRTKPPLAEYYGNIREEASRTVDLALLNEKNLSSSLDDFISLSSSALDEHGIENDMDYVIESSGDSVKVTFDLYLSFGQSFLSDSIIIERTIYR